MGRLEALYRYPVKGLSPEPVARVRLESGRHFPGDRLAAVENGPSGFDPARPSFTPKSRFLTLAHHPALARARTTVEPGGTRLRLRGADGSEEVMDLATETGRAALGRALRRMLDPENLRGGGEVLVHADHRFTDDPDGHVSLVNLASLRDLSRRLGRSVDPLRFRANLYVDDLPPWAELTWSEGEVVEIGEARLLVGRPIVRCLATHVDPATGERDLEILPTLFAEYGHRFCGLYLKTALSGEIGSGDRLVAPRRGGAERGEADPV